MDEIERRHALADFLRTRRMRLGPGEVGLPPGLRRRTPGLRREEVAMLAGIGTSWYTSLEQSRDVHPSGQVLESLARVLLLTADERRHLFLLAGQGIPADAAPSEEVNPGLYQMVENLDPHPAYIMGRRWDLLAWNRAADLLFSFNEPRPPHSRNMLWRVFANPEVRARNADWEGVTRFMLAQFRADYARYPGDPWFAGLIDDLHRAVPEFGALWSRHDVQGAPNCHKRIEHPALGYLEFEHFTLQTPTHPDLKIVIYSATPETASRLTSRLEAGVALAAGLSHALK